MKSLAKSPTFSFSAPTVSRYISKLTAVACVTIAAAFSTSNALADGEALYKTKCIACHGPTGTGIPNVFPPVAESEWVNGPEENLIKIQLRGLQGPIEVKGVQYNSVMPANAAMTDKEIADVLTYVRSNMGNDAPAVTVETVKKIRAEVAGNLVPVTVKDLIDPKKVEKKEAPAKPAPKPTAEARPAQAPAAEPAPEKVTTTPAIPVPAKPKPAPTVTKPEAPKPAPAPKAEAEPVVAAPAASGDGKAIYQAKCIACHGSTGGGVANVFPPLAESEWVNGPAENLIKIQIHGLTGPIEVKGVLYNSLMPGNAAMSNEDIATVLTYVRSNMGNTAGPVSADEVAKIRDAAGENPTPITAKDLLDPTVPSEVEPLTGPTELEGFKPAVHNTSGNMILWVLGIIGVCTLPAIISFLKN